MTKRLNMTVLLGTAGLVLPLLAGCGTPKHTHVYVEHPAHAATCTEPGNELYWSCEGCDKFFNADKTKEIEEGSWVTDPLGHNLKLTYGGQFKTSYLSGETFDATGLVIKEVCQRQGCEFEEVVTDYTISYQTQAQKFVAGDTKVVVTADELSVDVPVSVQLRENVISGLEASYDIKCKEGISLDGVTATKGAVSIKYYSDEECTQEVSKDELIGEDTYYGKVVSDGVDTDYEIAEAFTTINVTHDLEEQVGKVTIGYKDNVCKICEYQEASENLMADADIKLEALTDYGMNADHWTKDNTEGCTVPGAPAWNTDSHTEQPEFPVDLPKVNYAAYTNVIFTFESNADDGAWGNIGLGIFKANDLITKAAHGKYAKYVLEVQYDALTEGISGKLEASDGSFGKFDLDNPDVVNGTQPLELIMNAANSRGLYLTKIMLNHTHKAGETTEARRDYIGYTIAHCETCGALMDGPLMTEEDAKFGKAGKKGYADCFGANCDDSYDNHEPGTFWGKDVTDEGGICFVCNTTYDPAGLDRDTILPRVDYRAVGKITFVFKALTDGSSRNISMGVAGDATNVFAMGNHARFNLTFSYDDVEEKMVIVADDLTNGKTVTVKFVADETVISGQEGVHIRVVTNLTGTRFGLNKVLINHSCDNCTKTTAPRTDVIGKKTATCDCCGLACDTDELMNDKDFTLNYKNAYGAKNWALVGEIASWTAPGCDARNALTVALQNAPDKEGSPKGTTDGVLENNLPRIDYTAYEKVQFELRSKISVFQGVGIVEANDLITLEDHGSNYYGMVYITCDKTTKVLTIQYVSKTSQYTKTVTLEDADVATGVKGLPMKWQQASKAYNNLTICRWGFNHDAHDNEGAIVATDVIGYKDACCSTCGEKTGQKSSQVMESSDISFATSIFGANLTSDITDAGNYCKYMDGYICYNFGAKSTVAMNLPKVNLALYSKVQFNIVLPSGWFKFGLDETKCAQTGEDATAATLVIEKGDTGYTAKLTWMKADKTTLFNEWTSDVTDADILSGAKAFALYGKEPYNNPNRVVRIMSIELTKLA